MMRRRSDLPPVEPQPWSALTPASCFAARLAQMRDVLVDDVLVDDETYAPLYKESVRGRPSIPPSLVVLTMLLQYHDDCSDAETEARVRLRRPRRVCVSTYAGSTPWAWTWKIAAW